MVCYAVAGDKEKLGMPKSSPTMLAVKCLIRETIAGMKMTRLRETDLGGYKRLTVQMPLRQQVVQIDGLNYVGRITLRVGNERLDVPVTMNEISALLIP